MQKETDPTVEFEPLVLDSWRARWIWKADADASFIYFRKTVELTQAPQQSGRALCVNDESLLISGYRPQKQNFQNHQDW